MLNTMQIKEQMKINDYEVDNDEHYNEDGGQQTSSFISKLLSGTCELEKVRDALQLDTSLEGTIE